MSAAALCAGLVYAATNVPSEYYPNYQIAGKREQLIWILEDIEAANTVWSDLDEAKFTELHDIFKKVFEYFPQSPTNNVIYKQCLLTTEELGKEYSENKYYTFRDRCFVPIGDIVSDIQTKYTVKPDIVVKPKDGPSPLNVTLDARGSIDPSNDTIPSDHFYWYYKDVDGDEQPIGKGPVVNYTFTKPGNHIVHLTVRSSNNLTEGIFDGDDSVSVNVAPRAANIVVYVDGKRATTDFTLKVGTQDAKDGIFIDGTATAPIGARTIISHVWTIQGTQPAYNFKKSADGAPDQFQHIFPENGIYTLTLELLDNEGNRLKESYKISVSDPVASIKVTPKDATTSDTLTFDASASYSLTSKIKSYQWLITDPSGNQLDIFESKDFMRKFTIPGTYTVKLTVTDLLGTISYDTMQVYIWSTPPIPTFKVDSTSDLKYPSQFILDAAGTFDEDVRNGADELTYERFFSPNQGVTVNRVVDNGKQLIISVDEPAKYKVKLLVWDSYGEQTQIEKDLEVISTLRPELMITPVVANRGNQVSFAVKTNKSVAFYNWDFGDGSVQQTQEPTTKHFYNKAGIYDVKLTVVTPSGESNEIVRQVFMGQQDMPIVAYEVKNASTLMYPQATCVDNDGRAMPAFLVERYKQITIDANKSVNVLGAKNDLAIAFHPQNDEIYAKPSLTYNFPTIWCQYVDVIVDDTNVGKSSVVRTWFEVVNSLPTLQNLLISFPQAGGGNAVGIGVPGAWQGVQREIFNDVWIDPIVVSLQAQGARDDDGVLSHFVWYYYPSDDPDRIISLKITPASVPSTTFVVPKPHYPTEYAFGVRLVDNDGGEQTSEALLGKGPIIFFPPGENSLDVPLVTLIAETTNARVGEPVNFTTKASILSQKPDFDATRYFKYDFDGDGEVDLTTKDDKVSYTYETPGEKKPKVTVYYRGRAGVGNSEIVTVQKSLTPILVTSQFDKYVLVKDLSMGDIEARELCMDTRICATVTGSLIHDQTTVLYTYPEYGTYLAKLSILDTFGNSQAKRATIAVTPPATGEIGVLSIPEAITMGSGGYEISVGRALDNEISLYIVSSDNQCGVDLDITFDSDRDGSPNNDADLNCNELYTHKFEPTAPEQWAKIWMDMSGERVSYDLVFKFLDVEEVVIPEEYQFAYDEITDLLLDLPVESVDEETIGFFRTLLINLRSSLWEKDEMSSLVIDLRHLLDEYPTLLEGEYKARVETLLTTLSDSTVQSSFGGTIYDTSKSNALVWLNETSQDEVKALFDKFEAANGNQDEMKVALDEIFKVASRERDAGNIDIVDFNYIKNSLCDIVVYYELPSKTCGTEENPDVIDDQDGGNGASKGVLGKVIKVVLIIVGILASVFIVLVVLFAIKARRQKQADAAGEVVEPKPAPKPIAPVEKSRIETQPAQDTEGDVQQSKPQNPTPSGEVIPPAQDNKIS